MRAAANGARTRLGLERRPKVIEGLAARPSPPMVARSRCGSVAFTADMFRTAGPKTLCRKDFGRHVRLPACGAACSRTSTWAFARRSATAFAQFSDNLGWTGLVPSAKCPFSLHAPVAQLDRASGFEPAGPPFESGRAR